MYNQKGFTLFELIVVIVWLGGVVVSGTLIYWVIRALIRFVEG